MSDDLAQHAAISELRRLATKLIDELSDSVGRYGPDPERLRLDTMRELTIGLRERIDESQLLNRERCELLMASLRGVGYGLQDSSLDFYRKVENEPFMKTLSSLYSVVNKLNKEYRGTNPTD